MTIITRVQAKARWMYRRTRLWNNSGTDLTECSAEQSLEIGTKRILHLTDSAKCTAEWTKTKHLKWSRISRPNNACSNSLTWSGYTNVEKSTEVFTKEINEKRLSQWAMPRKKHWMRTCNFWTRALDGDVKFSGQIKFISKTQTHKSVLSMCRNVGYYWYTM